ncbi:MAG: DegV family EDD domain-containing protein [Oscillospiraceae bacterium]|nr:DegV family EDD domain-containing protein [Oscillospiraceae bacterium]
MIWHLVSDSSCDLFQLEGAGESFDFSTVPFAIQIGKHDFLDEQEMDIDAMLRENESSAEVAHTACPSLQTWLDQFSKPGPVLAFTISSALSGSYNSAVAAKQLLMETEPDKQIEIIDSRATGPELAILIRLARSLVEKRFSFENIAERLHEAADRTHIIFALKSYHNLIKNGRVSKLKALVAGHLGFWGIGVGDEAGEIAMRGKARGVKNMIRFLLNEIKETGVAGKEIIISHCFNEEAALELKRGMQELFSGISVDILPTRGLDSFYAERGGLIIGY